MTKKVRNPIIWFLKVCIAIFLATSGARFALAETAAEIDSKVDAALENLFADSPSARELSETAKGILVFPDVVKGGFMIGGHHANGALREDGKTTGYYNTVEVSYGLQLGAQSFGYALFFMNEAALEYVHNSDGWEIGIGPNITIVDEGLAGSLTTTTAKEDIYAFFFDQKGLMAGLGLKGGKISPITPDK